MTVVSTLLGVAAPMFLPRWFVHWAAVILFLGYGVTMLYNSQFMSDKVSEEFEEVEHELDELANERSGKKSDDNNTIKDDDDITVSLAEKGKSSMKKATKVWRLFSFIWVKSVDSWLALGDEFGGVLFFNVSIFAYIIFLFIIIKSHRV